jgi:exodeoxyribonuclease VIII
MIAEGKTPAHVLARRTHSIEPNAAMILGTTVHSIVLHQPDDIVVVEHDGRTKEGKAERARAAEEKPHAQVVNSEMYAKAMDIAESVRAHPLMKDILQDAEYEVVFTEKSSKNGVPIKARADIVSGGSLFDLKTTSDASFNGFMRSIRYGGYHIQAAHYVKAAGESCDFGFIAVETEFPYMVQVFLMGPAVMRGALMTWKGCIAPLVEAETTGIWKGYSDEMVVLDQNNASELI